MTNEEHHLGPPPLQMTSLGMVSGFPLDYMHLIYLMLWLRGPLSCTLSSLNTFPKRCLRLSQRLVYLKSYTPSFQGQEHRKAAELSGTYDLLF